MRIFNKSSEHEIDEETLSNNKIYIVHDFFRNVPYLIKHLDKDSYCITEFIGLGGWSTGYDTLYDAIINALDDNFVVVECDNFEEVRRELQVY